MNIILLSIHWIVNASLRASLLAVAIPVLQIALRGLVSARGRYMMWLPLLLVLTLPVLPQSRWSVENLFKARAQPTTPFVIVAATPSSDVVAPVSPVVTTPSTDWKESVPYLVWAAGVLVSLGGGAALYMKTLRQFIQSAEKPEEPLKKSIASLSEELRLRLPPRIILSPAVGSPGVTGLLRPVLLLPAGFMSVYGDCEARLVLKHELMHIKRLDLQINALATLLLALHWFNPLLWFASWRVRQDREAACDAQVLASETGDCRNAYGNVLLKVQSGSFVGWMGVGFVGIFESWRALRSRIKAIARYRRPSPFNGIVAAVAIVLLGVLGATHAQDAASGSPSLATSTGPAQAAGPNELITKEYKPLKSFRAAMGKRTPLDYLSAQGLPFPPGANVMYWSKSNRLIVHNTKSNIGVLDVILHAYLAPMDYTPQTGRLVVRDTPENQDLVDAVAMGVNGEQTVPDTAAPEDANAAATDDTRQKLNNLIIPKFEFSNATMQDIVTYLNQESVRLDAGESIPSRRGVRFVLAAAPRGAGKISLSLDQMPMWEVVKYVADLSGLKVRVDPGSVTFLSPSSSSD